VECQAEERSATGISIYEFEHKTPNEKFLWNAWKQAGNKNKTQQDRNSTLMECEIDMDTP
jgi:hypothetical protein